MLRIVAALLCVVLLIPFPPHSARAEDQAQGSGLPIPRFVALKSDDVNVRTGPGERYPISWVYKRDHFPVEIIEEFDHWRKIRDMDGAEGWVHKNLLEGRRSAIVRGEVRVIRRAPDDKAAPLIRAEAGVIGKLLECKEHWCRIQIESRKGWIRKTHMFGAYAKEEF